MQELLLAWWDRNRADLPWCHTHDPYAISSRFQPGVRTVFAPHG